MILKSINDFRKEVFNMKVIKKIGENFIGSAKLSENWKRSDLHKAVTDIIESKGFAIECSTFYLKIYGNYDKAMFEDFHPCSLCPYNKLYKHYHDYNELLDDKIQVIVLK